MYCINGKLDYNSRIGSIRTLINYYLVRNRIYSLLGGAELQDNLEALEGALLASTQMPPQIRSKRDHVKRIKRQH